MLIGQKIKYVRDGIAKWKYVIILEETHLSYIVKCAEHLWDEDFIERTGKYNSSKHTTRIVGEYNG